MRTFLTNFNEPPILITDFRRVIMGMIARLYSLNAEQLMLL
ncbi:MAG: hypothetical protein RLZZ115_1691 [Cyanobacteriota bacterium]|jgi:hypothetical protein